MGTNKWIDAAMDAVSDAIRIVGEAAVIEELAGNNEAAKVLRDIKSQIFSGYDMFGDVYKNSLPSTDSKNRIIETNDGKTGEIIGETKCFWKVRMPWNREMSHTKFSKHSRKQRNCETRWIVCIYE